MSDTCETCGFGDGLHDAVRHAPKPTRFIVPGDILRGLQAELRHRGFSVEEAEAYAMGDDMIVVATQASRGVAGGTVVAVFHRVAGNVMVKSATFGLEFTFRGEES